MVISNLGGQVCFSTGGALGHGLGTASGGCGLYSNGGMVLQVLSFSTGVTVSDNVSFGWRSGDLLMYRAAAATLQLGTNHATTATAQRIQAHGVTTGTGADLELGGGSGSTKGNVILDGGNRAAYDAAPSTTVIRDILISHGLMAAS
jgi:hypothetical protein